MKIEVLNKGFIELVDKLGDDYSILRSARVSTGSDVIKGKEKDRGLIRYLYRNNHLSPFEFVQLHFHIKAPLFIVQQLLRHRTMSFNQSSTRYKEFEWEDFLPEEWRLQDNENKQSSFGSSDHQELTNSMVKSIYKKSELAYSSMLDHGIAKEQARVVMPVAQYTELYFSVNLRNLFHFLELRLHPHAQYEIKVYAEAIVQILRNLGDIKWSVEIFEEVNKVNYIYQELLNQNKNDLNKLENKLKKVLN